MTWFATVPHPAKPKGWDITWGAQVDPRVVRLTDDGEVTDIAVASYLAKYATKSTEPVGAAAGRITPDNAPSTPTRRTHQGRLIPACLKLGSHPHEDFQALRRWAHMLGYRGHFATKSRRYSTTMRALRAARRDWQRRQHPARRMRGDKTVITHHRPGMGRTRLAHHRRRTPRTLRRRPSPRARAVAREEISAA